MRLMLIERELEKRKKLEKLGIKYDFPGYVCVIDTYLG